MFVLGTVGHVDHGKSVLVHALSGIDPDRLREEKERGMTIDLGFAWFKLPSGQEVGIVDVPGHEHFIKNMLAGVGGIDLALLIVAANEGVRPQTREHLAILDVFGVRKCIVVITKKDLVDDEWLNLVKLEVGELIKPTSLSQAPLVAVSALTGEGLTDLLGFIDNTLTSIEPRKDVGHPRLPIDRIFTIAGSGTVVTGTLIDGSLTLGQEVEIVPPKLKSRIRGLQMHKSRIDTASPGSRVAVNLSGISKEQLHRGDVLTDRSWLESTLMLTVRLQLLGYLRHALQHNATVSFHTGAAETIAKVRLLEEDKLRPGQATIAQIVLDEPVALVRRDCFIIRSPMETLGGGEVIEPHTRRYRRFRPHIIESIKVKESGTIEEIIMTTLETDRPVALTSLLKASNLPVGEIKSAVESLVEQGKIISIGSAENRLFLTATNWEYLIGKINTILQDYHQKYPLRAGLPGAELVNRLQMGKYTSAILQRLDKENIICYGANISLPSHTVRLTQAQQEEVDKYLREIEKNPYTTSNDFVPDSDLLNLMVERQMVVKLSDDIIFSSQVYEKLVERVVSYLDSRGKVTVAEVRDMFKTSRKYALALLVHLDQQKITRRVGDERVLY